MRRGYAGRPIRPLFQGRNQGVSREFFRETDVADDVGDPDDRSVGDSILQTASIARWVSGGGRHRSYFVHSSRNRNLAVFGDLTNLDPKGG